MNGQTIIGIDLGGTNIKSGIISADGAILLKRSRPTQAQESYPVIYENIKNSIQELLSPNVIGVGIGSPGWIQSKQGIIGGGCENIPAINGAHLKEELEKEFSIPVYIDNDANNHAKGEYLFGAGKGFSNVMLITLGTGIGAGLILNNQVFHGAWDYAGEIGHITLFPDGQQCNCGNRGCFEQYASAGGMVRNAMSYMHRSIPSKLLNYPQEDITAKFICELAEQGDAVCNQVIMDTAKYIGIILGSVLNLLNLDLILIGGGVAAAGELLLKPIRLYTQSHCLQFAYKNVKIQQAALGNDAGILGSAAMVLLEGKVS